MRKLNIYIIPIAIFLSMLFISCSNDKDRSNPDDSTYISLLPFIKQSQARVNGNSFVTGDAIGVYVVPFANDNETPGAINESSYAPNVELAYNGSSWFIVSGGRIPWPSLNRKVDIYSYYPYDAALGNINALDYYFSVKADQQTKVAYEASDFLWAKTADVSPTRNPVDLSFSHKLSKVRVNVKSEVDTLNSQLATAVVSVVNTNHSASINLSNGNITVDNSSDTSPVVTFRHSNPAEGYLLSTEAILIPQTAANGEALIRIDIPANGTRYSYVPTGNLALEPGTERTFNITITSLGLSVTVGSIIEWQPSEIIEGEIGKPIPKVLDLNDIVWEQSLVQKIYDNGIQIGQISREFLYRSGTVDAPAIVVYLMNADGEIDESSGFVARVFNRAQNSSTNEYEPNTSSIHGGTVVWGSSNAITTYTAGNQALFDKIEVSSSGIRAVANTAITTLNIMPEQLEDIDGNLYSIVKISGQYWTSENIKTERYRDGSSLTCYYYNDDKTANEIYGALYSWFTVVDSRGLAPEGWRVPENNDFVTVYEYLRPDAGRKLKGNILWNNLNNNDNVSGFNALPTGLRNTSGSYNDFYHYGQLWSATSTGTTTAYCLYFDSGDNAMHNTTANKNNSFSIRLLRN